LLEIVLVPASVLAISIATAMIAKDMPLRKVIVRMVLVKGILSQQSDNSTNIVTVAEIPSLIRESMSRLLVSLFSSIGGSTV
jgi:hypothetical protein